MQASGASSDGAPRPRWRVASTSRDRALQQPLVEPDAAPLVHEQLGAALLVVGRERLVDRIVKQQRQLDLGQLHGGEARQRVEARQDVLPGVVATVRLVVAHAEPREQAGGTLEGEPFGEAGGDAGVHAFSVGAIGWCYNQSMGRSSLRTQRRTEIARAFARVLGAHGRGGATIAAVAAEAGVAPGLVHHHFESKQDLYAGLLDELLAGFRRRLEVADEGDPIRGVRDGGARARRRRSRRRAGVGRDLRGGAHRAHTVREGEAHPGRGNRRVEGRAAGDLSTADASAVVAFVVGALVLGAFAPRKTAGFAAPSLRRMLTGLRTRRRE